MRNASAVLAAALVLTAANAGASSAQTVPGESRITVSRGQFDIEPFGGYLIGQSLIEGPIGTSLNVAAAPLYGVKVGIPLAPSSSLLGTVAYSTGDLEGGIPIIGGIRFGMSETYVYDASVELRAGSSLRREMRFTPLVQLGGGATHRALTVSGVTAKATDFHISGGIGADIPVMSNVALRIMAKDYWGKADFGSLGPLNASTREMHTVALTAGARVTF